jgi:Putative metal-binding motif/Secretion system C-terminal sorting domain
MNLKAFMLFTALFLSVVVSQAASITCSTSATTLCGSNTFTVSYVVTGGTLTAGNIFTVQLSDRLGSFAAPVAVGTLTSTTTTGNITATLPNTTIAGTAYRVRVVSSAPATTGAINATNISVTEFYSSISVFSETIGTGGNTTIAAYETANGFDNDGYTMSGTARVRSNSPSTGYTGATGSGNILFAATNQTFIISGINTVGMSNLALGFGVFKSTTTSTGSNIVVSVSTNGTTYTNLSFGALPTGTGTNNKWYYRTTTGTIPATANLRIRFQTNSGVQMRVDDMILTQVTPLSFSISPSSAQNTCAGTPVVLAANAAGGATYLWSNSATTSSISVTTAGSYSVTASGVFGCKATRGPVAVTVTPTVTPTIIVNRSPTGTICAGTNVTFTATITNGGTTPVYQWKKNGVNVGTSAATFSSTTLANGDVITCSMTSSAACATPSVVTSTANVMTVTTPTAPTVTILANPGSSITTGQSVTFTATPTNGGTTPVYHWFMNGASVGGTGNTYTSSTLPNNAVVYCTMTSNATCKTTPNATSNSITMTVSPPGTPTINIAANPGNTICQGVSVTFTASITLGGTAPQYQWKVNGTNVGTNSSNFTSTTLNNGDVVTCRLTSNAPFIGVSQVWSSPINMTVRIRPNGYLSGTQTICAGSGAQLNVQINGTGTLTGTLSDGTAFSGTSPGMMLPVTTATNRTYTITSLSDDFCAANSGNMFGSTSVVVVSPVAYYLDEDGDGYGGSTSITSCTPVAGYVLNHTDCDDTNADISPGTDEWADGIDENCNGVADENYNEVVYYQDADGDGFGNALSTVLSTFEVSGYVTNALDCDDSSNAIDPEEDDVCNGIDDNCNGIVDENGCGVDNDRRESAFILATTEPTEVEYESGTLQNAMVSAESHSTCVTGEDVWYYFIAQSSAISIRVVNSTADILVELQNQNGTTLDIENSVVGAGAEVMNYGSLVAGNTYYVSIRNYNSALATGTFEVSAIAAKSSSCNTGVGPHPLCQSIGAQNTGANQYVFKYTEVGTTTTYTYTSNSIAMTLNSIDQILYNKVYQVKVDAVYQFSNGNGVSEQLIVSAATSSFLQTMPQPLIELNQKSACPNEQTLGSYISTTAMVCGAVDYQWEFTPYTGVTTPFTVLRGSSSTYLSLSNVGGLALGHTYDVRVRPVFANGVYGVWGDYQCMRLMNASSLEIDPSASHSNELEASNGSTDKAAMSVYPNPGNGENVIIGSSIFETEIATITIYDNAGREVAMTNTGNSSGFKMISFDTVLSPGVYVAVVKSATQLETTKFLVER